VVDFGGIHPEVDVGRWQVVHLSTSRARAAGTSRAIFSASVYTFGKRAMPEAHFQMTKVRFLIFSQGIDVPSLASEMTPYDKFGAAKR